MEKHIVPRSASKKKYVISNIIHFVWAGGDNKIPEESFLALLHWATFLDNHENFEIWVWVDPGTYWKHYKGSLSVLVNESKTEDLLPYLMHIFSKVSDEIGDNIATKTHIFAETVDAKLKKKLSHTPIVLKNVRTHGVLNTFAEYEILRPDPNYGASSDIIRYEVLKKFGGLYLDMDIMPVNGSKKQFVKLFKATAKQPLMYLNHLSQMLDPTEEEFAFFELPNKPGAKAKGKVASKAFTGSWGNDAILCTPNHPIIEMVIEQVKKHYTPRYSLKQQPKALQAIQHIRAFNSYYPRDITIQTTGPAMLAEILSQWCIKNYHRVGKPATITCGDKQCLLGRFNTSKTSQLLQPIQNRTTWLGIKVYPQEHTSLIKMCDERLRATIEFEAKQFGIFRLDDHLYHISVMLDRSIAESSKALQLGELTLSKSTVDAIDIVQYTASSGASLDFIKRHELVEKTLFHILGKHPDAIEPLMFLVALEHWVIGATHQKKFLRTYQPRLIYYMKMTTAFIQKSLANKQPMPRELIHELVTCGIRNIILVRFLFIYDKLPKMIHEIVDNGYRQVVQLAMSDHGYRKEELLSLYSQQESLYSRVFVFSPEIADVFQKDLRKSIVEQIELIQGSTTSGSEDINADNDCNDNTPL